MAASVVVRRRPGPVVRRPSPSARSTRRFYGSGRVLHGRVRGAASSPPRGTWRAGWRCPVPAMSGAEPWTGSNRPGRRGSPSEALGQHAERAGEHRRLVAEDVAEHVLGERSRRSRRGRETSCIAALSTSMWSSSTSGYSSASHAARRPRARGARSRARSPCPTLVTLRGAREPRSRRARCARSPPTRVGAGVVGACRRRGRGRRSRCRRSARARRAGRCPRSARA